jgi:hypothetical protein
VESLNLIGKGNISKMIFDDICDIYRNYSTSQLLGRNYPSNLYSTRAMSSITKWEAGNLLKELKIDFLIHMGKKIDTLYTCRKKEEAKKVLALFFPTYPGKHGSEQYPYNRTNISSLEETNINLTLRPLPEGISSIEYFK